MRKILIDYSIIISVSINNKTIFFLLWGKKAHKNRIELKFMAFDMKRFYLFFGLLFNKKNLLFMIICLEVSSEILNIVSTKPGKQN